MPRHVFQIENGKLGLSIDDPGVPVDTATIADYSDFSCQIVSGALNATSNVTDTEVPATWCEPAATIPSVGQTSYELAVSILQDPDVVDGISMFLFEHDTEQVFWFMGLDGDDPPKAIGVARCVAGTIGGEARTTLTADVTLPVEGKPTIEFGNATSSEVVGGTAATGATEVAGAEGTWTPTGSTPPATVADLIAGTPNAVIASPTTAWTTGSFVQTRAAGAGGQAYWNGTAWTAGVAALGASAASSSSGSASQT